MKPVPVKNVPKAGVAMAGVAAGVAVAVGIATGIKNKPIPVEPLFELFSDRTVV
jgi:hypothetical protein